MTGAKVMTKREVINELLREDLIQDTPMYKDYLEHELELLDRKNASSKSSNNEETQEIAYMLLEEMEKFEATGKTQYTITELMKFSDVIQNYTYGKDNDKVLSNSKITSIFKTLLADKKIANVKDKKNSYYSLAK